MLAGRARIAMRTGDNAAAEAAASRALLAHLEACVVCPERNKRHVLDRSVIPVVWTCDEMTVAVLFRA